MSKAAGPKNSSGRSAELPLAVLPISIQSPLAQDFKRSLTMPEDEGRGCFGTKGEEDSLLTNSELAAGAVSSILRDYDLRRADAMSVENVLALSLQGATTVCPDAFICLSYFLFRFALTFVLFWHMATYVKSLAKRACLSQGSAKAAEAYKAEVVTLTSERANLLAQVRHLSEDAAMHRSDLKHTLMAKSRAEEQEKKARDELRAAAYELRMVKDKL